MYNLIKIVCVGKIKEKYLRDAIDEYCKRLSKYTKLEIIEVADVDKIPVCDILDKEGIDILKRIKEKDANLKGTMATQGTTPRQLTDLIGSLCDLTSGSGDKGTPVILVQGYFDNYTND